MTQKALKIGLALGGGAARGVAHIPMLGVFDELGIRPAVIAGTSIGALVGVTYAAGISAADIRQHTERLFGHRLDLARHLFGSRGARLTDLLTLTGYASFQIQTEKLVELLLPDDVPKTFEELGIPFKVVVTDYEQMVERVIDKGPLVPAIAASIAIPGIFQPTRLDGRLHVDGGVTNPVPFNHVRDGMDVVVAIDVSGRPRAVGQKMPSNMELAVGSMHIMFKELADMRRALNPPDIYIRPAVDQFGSGDFLRWRDIMAGAETARENLRRSLKVRLPQPDPVSGDAERMT